MCQYIVEQLVAMPKILKILTRPVSMPPESRHSDAAILKHRLVSDGYQRFELIIGTGEYVYDINSPDFRSDCLAA